MQLTYQNRILPWHTLPWQTLWQAKCMERLPSALLLTGQAGLGKKLFAERFVLAMLCQNQTPEGFSCADAKLELCSHCRLINTYAHPNVSWVSPEENSVNIKIEQIREAINFVNQTSFAGTFRFVIITPAHAMNVAAANALLKTLEEPAPYAMLILISQQSEKLPATIRSRCQRIVFQKPSKNVASVWLCNQIADDGQNADTDRDVLLELAQGSPLLALKFMLTEHTAVRRDLYHHLLSILEESCDPSIAAKNLMAYPEDIQFELLITWLLDLLRLQLGGNVDSLRNQDFKQQLSDLKSKTNVNKNMKLLNHVKELQQIINNGIHLNKQLALESILIDWADCGRTTDVCF